MRYAIGILTSDYGLHACHQVADSQDEAILNALESLNLYDGEPIDNLEEYLYDIDAEVDLLSIEETDSGCVLAMYDADGDLAVDYYQNQTSYEAVVHMLGNIVPRGRVKSLNDLIEFIEELEMRVDTQEVKYHD
jgi:hypothetical protein